MIGRHMVLGDGDGAGDGTLDGDGVELGGVG